MLEAVDSVCWASCYLHVEKVRSYNVQRPPHQSILRAFFFSSKMDLSDSFDDPETSDVILRFRASTQPVAGEEEGFPDRSFSVHRVVLYASPYFKALLQRWQRPTTQQHAAASQQAHASPCRVLKRSCSVSNVLPCASADLDRKALLQRWNGSVATPQQAVDQPPPARFQLVEHVELDELEAAEMVLRCLYKTGELPQPAHGNPMLLLKMHRLADKYQFPARCMESITTVLSALNADQVSADFVSAVYSLPPELLPLEPRLLALCRKAVTRIFRVGSAFDPPLTGKELERAMVQIFGDVPAIISSIDLRGQFCGLPFVGR